MLYLKYHVENIWCAVLNITEQLYDNVIIFFLFGRAFQDAKWEKKKKKIYFFPSSVYVPLEVYGTTSE